MVLAICVRLEMSLMRVLHHAVAHPFADGVEHRTADLWFSSPIS